MAQISMSGAWVKMEYHRLLDLEHAKNKLAAQDKSEVREIAKALNAPGGIEKLGPIVVADMFNANQDRFVFVYPLDENQGYGGGYPQGTNPGRTNFNHLINFGNIIVTRGAGAAPIGLDSWDPNNAFAGWKSKITSVEAAAFERWPGRFLAPSKMEIRKKLAARCVEDLNFVLGQRHRKLPVLSKLRLNKNAAERMARGIENGIGILKNMIQTRYRGTGSKGLRERCTLLGWSI